MKRRDFLKLTDDCRKLAAHFAAHGFENAEQRAINTMGRKKAFKRDKKD